MRSAHDPHQRTTRLRSVSRARKRRTAALFGVIPASEAKSRTETPSTSTRRSARAYSGFSVSESWVTHRQTASRSSGDASGGASSSSFWSEASARSDTPRRR